jgi:hypothetical protein
MSYRFKAWYLGPLTLCLMALVMLIGVTAAHATTYNTMRPAGNTAYCVADLTGGLGGSASLIDPCNEGSAQAWGVTSSAWGDSTYQIQNEYTGLCLETNGGNDKLATTTCNGDKAQAWFYDSVSSTENIWVSPYTNSGGTNYCADANATYGVRAIACNQTGAQVWDGPASFG